MNRPLYFCSGLKRSGSTWSYNVARLLLQKKLESMVCGYVGEFEAVGDYLAKLDPNTPALMKFHYAGEREFDMVKRGEAKNIYTYRHPIMAVASEMDFFKNDFDVAMRNITAGLQMMDKWKSMPGTLFIDFEDLCNTPLNEIIRIAQHFDCQYPQAVYEAIDAETSFERSKAVSKEVAQRPDSELAVTANTKWDKLTLFHADGHVSEGLARRWEKTLSPEQVARATEVFKPWLSKMEG